MQEYIEFAQRHPLLIIGFLVVLGLIFWAEFSRLTCKYTHVNANQAVQVLNKDNVTVLDVREGSELHSGVIKGARTIPVSDVAKHLTEFEKDKNNPFLVYCASGNRSGGACNTLTKNGFENVYNLTGGLMTWKAENLPLSKK
ncbi:MAG: rhodanese-like domain-containing protein [Cocleimonas sp.]|nr:rhodanese-like domain-containing protein [Cocleimonas sp.]